MRLRSTSRDPREESIARSSRKKQGSDVPSRQLTVIVSKMHPTMNSISSSKDSYSFVDTSSQVKLKWSYKWFELQETEVDLIKMAKECPGQLRVSDDGKRIFTLDIRQLDVELIKRQEIIHELIQTERDYLNDLKMVANLFIAKMGDKGILSAAELQTVFSNWQSLIQIHEAFLVSLETRKRNGLGIVKNVASVVCDFGSMLSSTYETYCVNHPAAMAFLESAEKNEKLHVYLQYGKLCQFRPETRGLNLVSFLLLPIQRLCKYPLLLKELVKHTPSSDSEHQSLEKALTSLSTVVGQINDRKRVTEQTREADKLLSSIDPRDAPIDLTLRRQLLHRGQILKLSGTTLKESGARDLALLSDVLLIVKKPSHFSRLLVIANAWTLDALSVSFDHGKGIFVLHQPGQKRYCFTVKTDYDSNGWLDAFSLAKIDVTVQAASPEKECPSTSSLYLSKSGIDISTDTSESLGSLSSQEASQENPTIHTSVENGKKTPPPLLPKSSGIDSAKVVSPTLTKDKLFDDMSQKSQSNVAYRAADSIDRSIRYLKPEVGPPPVPSTPSPVSQGFPPPVPLKNISKNPAFQFFDALASKGPPLLPRSFTSQPPLSFQKPLTIYLNK